MNDLYELLMDLAGYMSLRGDIDDQERPNEEVRFYERIDAVLHTNSRLGKILEKMLPKRPEWKPEPLPSTARTATGAQMMIPREEPIRRHAECFVRALEGVLPLDETALIYTLWAFGEAVSGNMEKQYNAAMKLVHDYAAISVNPIQIMDKQK